jgi:hypothetical protein
VHRPVQLCRRSAAHVSVEDRLSPKGGSGLTVTGGGPRGPGRRTLLPSLPTGRSRVRVQLRPARGPFRAGGTPPLEPPSDGPCPTEVKPTGVFVAGYLPAPTGARGLAGELLVFSPPAHLTSSSSLILASHPSSTFFLFIFPLFYSHYLFFNDLLC